MRPVELHQFEQILISVASPIGAECGACFIDGLRSSMPVRDLETITNYATSRQKLIEYVSVQTQPKY